MLLCFTVRGRCQPNKKTCLLCFYVTQPQSSAKIYTKKELVMMDTYIDDFHTIFYVPSIKKIAFYVPHVHIL